MLTLLVTILIGLLGGIAVGVQGPLASLMGQRLGSLMSVLIVHVGGAVAAALLLLLPRSDTPPAWAAVPWYVFGCGALGVVVIFALNTAIPRIGVAASATLIIVGQLAASTLLDHFGLFGVAVRPFDINRALGLGVLLLGAWLVVR